jgi:hypothetical protein
VTRPGGDGSCDPFDRGEPRLSRVSFRCVRVADRTSSEVTEHPGAGFAYPAEVPFAASITSPPCGKPDTSLQSTNWRKLYQHPYRKLVTFRDPSWQLTTQCGQGRQAPIACKQASLRAGDPTLARVGHSLRVTCPDQLNCPKPKTIGSCVMQQRQEPERQQPFRLNPSLAARKPSPSLKFCQAQRGNLRQTDPEPHPTRLLPAPNSPSRRGDSNPGPLHYEGIPLDADCPSIRRLRPRHERPYQQPYRMLGSDSSYGGNQAAVHRVRARPDRVATPRALPPWLPHLA